MDAQARAGIEFGETALRYAEVEKYGPRYRLLRLGTCDFDFHLIHDVLEADDATSREVVAEALQDVFSGSLATAFHVTIHPPVAHSFVTSMRRSVSRDERERRLVQETALLTDSNPHTDVVIESHATDIGASPDVLVNVLATPSRVHRAIREILGTLSGVEFKVRLTTDGAGSVVNLLHQKQSSYDAYGPSFCLAIGAYNGFSEYCAVTTDGLIYSSHAPVVNAADFAFFGASFLQQLGFAPAQIDHLFMYGDAVPPDAYELLESLWEGRVGRLDPLGVVDLDPDTLTGEFASEVYAPCVGAAL